MSKSDLFLHETGDPNQTGIKMSRAIRDIYGAPGGDQGDAPDKQGFRGERTDDLNHPQPHQQRRVQTQDGPIEVEERSGVAFAEASGNIASPPKAPAPHHGPPRPSPALLQVALTLGALALGVVMGRRIWRLANPGRRDGFAL
jgi:hypothetical protein